MHRTHFIVRQPTRDLEAIRTPRVARPAPGRWLAFLLATLAPSPLLAVAHATQAPTTAEARERTPLEMSLATLAKSQTGSMSLTLTNETLEKAVERFRQAAGLPLLVDWEAIAALGIAKDDQISFEVTDAPPLVALKAFAASMEGEIDRPVVDATAGQLLITSPIGRSAYRELAIYDVADILADPFLIDAVAALQKQAAGKDEDEAEPDGQPAADKEPDHNHGSSPATTTHGDDAVAVTSSVTARAERLIEIIAEHIDPEGWDYNGGSRGKMTHEAGRLIITATAASHESLRGFLADLRQQSPSSATTTWTIASLPTAALDSVTAAHPSGSDTPSLLADVRAAAGFRLLSTPRVSVRLEDAGVVEASDAANSARCSVTVSLDRARRTLAVRTSVQLAAGAAKALGESTFTGRGDHVSGLLRLPSGPREGETWVVLIETAADRRE